MNPLITILMVLVGVLAGGLVTLLFARRNGGSAASVRGVGQEGGQEEARQRVALLEQRLAGEEETRRRLEAAVQTKDAELASRQQEIQNLSIEAARALTQVEAQGRQIEALQAELTATRADREALRSTHQQVSADLTAARVALSKEQEKAAEKLTVLLEAKKELSDQFSHLANQILEEKSQRFAEQNKASLDQLLLPLRTQLTDFKGTVERAYVEEGKERSALAEQVKQLHALNTQLSAEAAGLTNALKGSSQRQGSWGEMVLERILESSGLRKGYEYRVQVSHTGPDGSRDRPDVIINLPEGKHLVIDSKNSLLDYNDHVNATSEAEREAAALRHLTSIRSHISNLSKKDYRSLHTLQTVDFVIMFVPIEPAFMLAIGRDPNLWTHAWEKNVLLVSPSTLLFTVRTVSHLWKQEQQRNQWQEIARQGGELYDKFSDFVADLSKLGDQLRLTQKSYDAAFNKLKSGRGNLIHRADALMKMGLKVKKPLAAGLVEEASDAQGYAPRALAAGAEEEAEAEPLLLDL